MNMLRCVVLLTCLSVFSAGAAVAGEVGALLGGVAGAVIGNNVGSRHNRDFNTLLGAVSGAVAGHALEEAARPSPPPRSYEPARRSYGEYGPRAYGYDTGGYGAVSYGRTPYRGSGGYDGGGRYYHSECNCSY